MSRRAKVAILGSGNIGTDLMFKVLRKARHLEMTAMVGIDRDSDGLRRAVAQGVAVSHEGVDGLLRMPQFADIEYVFDASSASAHIRHASVLREHGKRVIDLTPAALGPFVVPVVNLAELAREPNINMVTCGGQATIPVIAAIGKVARIHYAEIVCSIASRSAGPGTRANIDEFTQTTASAIKQVAGANRARAIIVLNPAEPPLLMRNTVFVLSSRVDTKLIERAVADMVATVQEYVPGYRLKQEVQFERVAPHEVSAIGVCSPEEGLKSSVFLQVEGAAHYLPAYAGNLDIMTSAALAAGDHLASGLVSAQ
jgi:acetaldehyde dehydrogenase